MNKNDREERIRCKSLIQIVKFIVVATPQPIAPTNLVPIGAPVPMMVMSAPMPQLSSFSGHAAVPFMGPNGQIIHQQLIANSPVPTHQMIPIFQQQQQSAAHFPISQSAQTQIQGFFLQIFFQRFEFISFLWFQTFLCFSLFWISFFEVL